MYKRPQLRTRAYVGGADAVFTSSCYTGRVGEILAKIHKGAPPSGPVQSSWSPPYDHEFYARHLDDPEPFLAKVAAFYEANPKPQYNSVKTQVVDYNLEPILTLMTKYPGKRPPIAEHLQALKEAGYSGEVMEKVRKHHQHMVDTDEERQAKLDAIFAKWPSSSKPTPKPKPNKPIKAVKKKMVPS